MSVVMHIKGSERGVIRVFHIDLPKEAVDRFTVQAGTGEWPVQYALGAKSLRSDFVEVVDVRDLGDMSLSDYLITAHDVNGAAFKAMRAQLDALKGHVLILASQAFNHIEQDLTISSPLRWIGTFNEPAPTSGGAPVTSTSASRQDNAPADPPRAPKKTGPNPGVIIAVLLVVAIAVIVAKFAVF